MTLEALIYNNCIVEMTLEALDKDSTLIKIKESGWKQNQESLDEYYSHCKGWNANAMHP